VPGFALNDEGEMLAARFPGLAQVQNPDRVAGGRELVARGVDVIVLDDGFQHRRLHRDRDLVCMDARGAPEDRMLQPAGRLREPLSGIRRADAVVLTRADQLRPEELDERRQALRALRGAALPVFAATHAPRDLLAMPSAETLGVSALRGLRVGLLSAIARPDAFRQTVESLGAEVAWHDRRRDHSGFRARDLERVGERAESTAVRLLVTEKDEAKLGACPVARWVLRVDLRFLDREPDGGLLGLCSRRDDASPLPT